MGKKDFISRCERERGVKEKAHFLAPSAYEKIP